MPPPTRPSTEPAHWGRHMCDDLNVPEYRASNSVNRTEIPRSETTEHFETSMPAGKTNMTSQPGEGGRVPGPQAVAKGDGEAQLRCRTGRLMVCEC